MCRHVSQSIWYLVVYLDLCECVIVSQCIDQSLHPCPGDKVGLQVQTSQCLVHPQHVTERLGGERGSEEIKQRREYGVVGCEQSY